MNTYATAGRLKDRIDISDTLDDSAILAALETISREIDRHCGRRFYVELATRYYSAREGDCLRVDDLLSLTSLKTDTSLDRTYATTWATTDYDLDPDNALQESPPEPYTRIYVAPLGRYSFSSARRGNQLVGKWGYYEVLETVSSALAEDLDASETGVDVVSGTSYNAGETILIDSEQMSISSISTNTLTVVRGINGTTAATHTNGAAIQRYTYPVIGELCVQQAILFFRGYSAPFGEIGGQDFKQSIAAGLHPFVRQGLETFRRMEQG